MNIVYDCALALLIAGVILLELKTKLRRKNK